MSPGIPSPSTEAFVSLDFPYIDSIDQLIGSSNFDQWHSTVRPILLFNPHSSGLVLGKWKIPGAGLSCPPEDQLVEARREWNAANDATCRFIRATLAPDVARSVQQYSTAQALFFNLVRLYGMNVGLDMQSYAEVPITEPVIWGREKNKVRRLSASTPRTKRSKSHMPTRSKNILPWCTDSISSSSSNVSSCSPILPKAFGHTHSGEYDPAQYQDDAAKQQHVTVVERRSTSPCPSIEKFDEEPHPGRRVPSGHIIGFNVNGIRHGGFEEPPHPGRRVPSGHIIGLKLNGIDDRSTGSISPLTLSDSDVMSRHYNDGADVGHLSLAVAPLLHPHLSSPCWRTDIATTKQDL